ncbi:MAG: 30S ribosomal protein S16 [Balneolaceae bacterium]
MIRLRLQRRGRRKRPYFHLVAADQRFPRDGRIIERLGRYDNISEKKELILDEERIIHWLRVGAQPSDTVRSLLKKEGILYKMHLMRWGKSEEEVEQALSEWRESQTSKESEEEVSRKERQKALLEAEQKEYKKQLEEKAAEAAKKAKAEKAKAEAEAAEQAKAEAAEDEAAAVADETAAEETDEKTSAETEEQAQAEDKTSEKLAEEEPAEEDKPVEASAEVKDEADDADEPKAAKEEQEEAAASEQLSTDMNATDAIEHIKNTPLEKLKGFVPESEDRVTVQRAWESKQAE